MTIAPLLAPVPPPGTSPARPGQGGAPSDLAGLFALLLAGTQPLPADLAQGAGPSIPAAPARTSAVAGDFARGAAPAPASAQQPASSMPGATALAAADPMSGAIGPATAATQRAASSPLPATSAATRAGLGLASPQQPLLAPQDGRPPAPVAVGTADRTGTARPLPAGVGIPAPGQNEAPARTAPPLASAGAGVARSTVAPLAIVQTQSAAARPEAVAIAPAADAQAPAAANGGRPQAAAPVNLAEPPATPRARPLAAAGERSVAASATAARRTLPVAMAPTSDSPGASDHPAKDQAWLEPGGEMAEVTVSRSEHATLDPVRAPAPGRATPPAPMLQVGVHIARAAPARIDRLFVQLEPATLGRVEVRLKFHRDDQVSAVIAAERPDTLDALQRDARLLERSLHQAGLRLDSDGLTFSLKREQAHHQRYEEGWFAPSAAALAEQPLPGVHDQPAPLHWFRGLRALDIRV